MKANLQQQNKIALVQAAAESTIQQYMQNLASDEDLQQNYGAWNAFIWSRNTFSSFTEAASSTVEQNEEYEQLSQALEANKLVLMDLLKRVENIQGARQQN